MVNIRLQVSHVVHAKAHYASQLTGVSIRKVYEAVLFFAMYEANPDEIAAKVEDYIEGMAAASGKDEPGPLPFEE